MTAEVQQQPPDPTEEGIITAWKAFARHAEDAKRSPCEQFAHAMRVRPGRPAPGAVTACCDEGFGLANYWIRCCEARLTALRRPRLV